MKRSKYTRPIRLGEQATSSETGLYTGSITIPEAISLIFRCADAEALFRTLEPTLRSEPLSRTARVTLRQGTQLREVALGTTA